MTARAQGDDRSGFRVAKNTISLVVLRVVTPLLSVAVVMAVSRLLGSDGLGRYTLAFTFLYFFNTVAPLGLYPVITREGARDPAGLGRLLSNANALGGAASIALAVVMAAIGPLLGYDDQTTWALGVLSLALVPYTIGSFFEAAFAALERMELIAIAAIVENVVKVGGSLALLALGHGLNVVLFAAVVGRVAACAVSFWLLRRAGIRVGWMPDREVFASLGRVAPTFLVIAIFATLYWRIDVFMLAQLRPVEDVGYYGAAWRLLEMAIIVPHSLCLALYPQMAGASPEKLLQLGRAATRYLIALGLPLAVGASVVAGPGLRLLYGTGFDVAADTLRVLMWTVIPYGWVRYNAYVLVALEHQRVDLWLNVAMSVTNIVLNLVLIPAYGHLGAGVATLASVALYGLAQYSYFRAYLPGCAAPLVLHPLPIAAAAASGASAWWLVSWSLPLGIGVGAVVYVVALLGSGFFTPTELEFLRVPRFLRELRPVVRRR